MYKLDIFIVLYYNHRQKLCNINDNLNIFFFYLVMYPIGISFMYL
jgi:hypothetical protein